MNSKAKCFWGWRDRLGAPVPANPRLVRHVSAKSASPIQSNPIRRTTLTPRGHHGPWTTNPQLTPDIPDRNTSIARLARCARSGCHSDGMVCRRGRRRRVVRRTDRCSVRPSRERRRGGLRSGAASPALASATRHAWSARSAHATATRPRRCCRARR